MRSVSGVAAGFGAPELIILFVVFVSLIGLGLIIWGIIDAASTPDVVWQAAGQNKVLWIVLQAIGLFVCGIGLILSIIYFAAIRPSLRRAPPGWVNK